MAKILVTGGAGYIGSHTVSELFKASHEVVIFDNLSTGFRAALHPKAAFIEGDIRDTDLLRKTMKEHKVDAIIHFAAKLNVKESTLKPLEYFENNTQGVISVLRAAQDLGVDKLVFSSTAALFGDLTQDRNIREDDPKQPLNPYGDSKMLSEHIIKDTASATSLRYVFLRYFNVAGAALDGNNGQRTADAYHLVHLASQAAVGKRKELAIFGTDYPTADGTCMRDYIHVEDLAKVHVLALQHLLAGGKSEEFNCGYGHGYSVKEVVEAMKKASGVDFKVVTSERRPGDAAFLVADSTKLRTQLQWKPQFDDIALICKTAFEWEKKV